VFASKKVDEGGVSANGSDPVVSMSISTFAFTFAFAFASTYRWCPEK